MNDDLTPGGRARLTQERSRQRRDQLVNAASRLFAEGGTKAITHRSVSEAADVPLATVSYYFASIDQLVDVMFLETINRWRSEWRSLTPAPDDVVTPDYVGERFRALVLGLSENGPARNLNVYLSSLLRPALREEIDAMRADVQGSMVAVVTAAGVADPGSTIRTLSLFYSGALVALSDPQVEAASVAELLRSEVTRTVAQGLVDRIDPEPEPV